MLEFLIAILISFGISSIIGVFFKVVQIITKSKKMEEIDSITPKKSESSIEQNQDSKPIIDLINSKISHELSISTSIKITSSSVVGFAGVVFALLLTTGIEKMFKIIEIRGERITEEITIAFMILPMSFMFAGLVLIIVPILYAFLKIVPEFKKDNVSMRDIIKKYHSSKKEALNEIETISLEELENLEQDNSDSIFELKRALVLFTIGLGLIFLVFLFGEGTMIDKIISTNYPVLNNTKT